MKAKLFLIALTACALSACGSDKTLSEKAVVECTGRSIGAGDRREAPSAVFVFAGQSNMVGQGRGSVAPIQNAVVWVSDHWETYQPRNCLGTDLDSFGPDLAFVQSWTRDNTGTIGILKYAKNGTSMADWAVDWSPEQGNHPEYGSLYYNLIKQIRAAAVPVAAFIWAQGEADARNAIFAPDYEVRVQVFVTALRAEFGLVPFVLAQTSVKGDYLNTIQTAQLLLTTWDCVGMVITMDLPTWDGVHYNTDSQLELGARLYSVWQGTVVGP